jgi:hypothetical protein
MAMAMMWPSSAVSIASALQVLHVSLAVQSVKPVGVNVFSHLHTSAASAAAAACFGCPCEVPLTGRLVLQ